MVKMEKESKEWLRNYYEGLGYSEHRIEQMLRKGEALEKAKAEEVRKLKGG
jgi:hypothetical protein